MEKNALACGTALDAGESLAKQVERLEVGVLCANTLLEEKDREIAALKSQVKGLTHSAQHIAQVRLEADTRNRQAVMDMLIALRQSFDELERCVGGKQ